MISVEPIVDFLMWEKLTGRQKVDPENGKSEKIQSRAHPGNPVQWGEFICPFGNVLSEPLQDIPWTSIKSLT